MRPATSLNYLTAAGFYTGIGGCLWWKGGGDAVKRPVLIFFRTRDQMTARCTSAFLLDNSQSDMSTVKSVAEFLESEGDAQTFDPVPPEVTMRCLMAGMEVTIQNLTTYRLRKYCFQNGLNRKHKRII